MESNESKESKYIMAIIKIPVEIQSNGKTVTHDDKMVMDFQNIDKLPETVQNRPGLNIFDNLFSNDKQSHTNENETTPEEPKKEDSPITNAIQQIFKNQIFVKKDEIQKKQRRTNTTFKNKKSKNQRISQKVYPFNSSTDQDVGLVQLPMGQELQHEDDQ
jgi:hypothetical protein